MMMSRHTPWLQREARRFYSGGSAEEFDYRVASMIIALLLTTCGFILSAVKALVLIACFKIIILQNKYVLCCI